MTISSAAVGLVLGILYVWSVVKSGIPADWGWSNADKALPYSVMCAAFSLTMIPAGRLQDRLGPRLVLLIGGFLAGLGCLVCGLGGTSVFVYILGFGILTGSGVGFGYSATTPASIKWFPAERTGLIAGIVVAGFGLAPLVLAPLTSILLVAFQEVATDGTILPGVSSTMISLGAIVWVVVSGLALLVDNPPEGIPPATLARGDSRQQRSRRERAFSWREMLSTRQFWLLFVMYFAGAAVGLMFISVAQDLGRRVLGSWAFMVVVILSTGNTFGRVLAGYISDRIGRQNTLFFEFVGQGLTVAALFFLEKEASEALMAILLVAFLLGLNYGTNLALFPAVCKDFYGIENFGLNYGCLFAAFGSAGLLMPWLHGKIRDVTGSSELSYYIVMVMMAVAALLALLSRSLGPPRLPERSEKSCGVGAVTSGEGKRKWR